MNPDESLKRAMAAWKVAPELPPRFQSEVWQRIADRESSGSLSILQRISEWVVVEFAKPSRAALVMATGLILSAGTAFWQAQDSNSRHWRQLETRYLDSINPLQEGRST